MAAGMSSKTLMVQPRKARPSRGRGLRTSTGCVTCRQRRVKCDEAKPQCGQCSKSDRGCAYSSPQPQHARHHQKAEVRVPIPRSHAVQTTTQPTGANISPATARHLSGFDRPTQATRLEEQPDAHEDEVEEAEDTVQESFDDGDVLANQQVAEYSFSPLNETSPFSPRAAPFEWYELLAQDAFNKIEKDSFLSRDPRWNFDPAVLLQRPSHGFGLSANDLDAAVEIQASPEFQSATVQLEVAANFGAEPWNKIDRIELQGDEIIYFQHFVTVVGPILDLFDPVNHFSNFVPHLAMHNVGLMKSVLAVAARHMSLQHDDSRQEDIISPSPARRGRNIATQYYYETLSYLSQAMPYHSYTRSLEILATSLMISTYEMFDGSNRDWERHLKGVFWIQRSQDNDGESPGLKQAVWWAWLRQDIWAAFRDKRRTLTIWRPKKPLQSLDSDELACRVLYLLAMCVNYAADQEAKAKDLVSSIQRGEELLLALEDWYSALPESFSPLPLLDKKQSLYPTIWIHPPAYAAATQIYNFAKIVVMLNKPSAGGINAYRESQRMLDEAVSMICGLAQSLNSMDAPRAFVSVQSIFAGQSGYTDIVTILTLLAGYCVQNEEYQVALTEILESCLDNSRWPPKSLISDLTQIWYR